MRTEEDEDAKKSKNLHPKVTISRANKWRAINVNVAIHYTKATFICTWCSSHHFGFQCNFNSNPIWMHKKEVKENETTTMYSFKHAENWSIFSIESNQNKKPARHIQSFPHHLSVPLPTDVMHCNHSEKIHFLRRNLTNTFQSNHFVCWCRWLVI